MTSLSECLRKHGPVLMILLIPGALFLMGCQNQGAGSVEEGAQPEHPVASMIKGFHLNSYYAGVLACAAEFVSCGAKKLALSPPLTETEMAVLLPTARQEAEKYGIPYYVEKDLLVTKLFRPAVAAGKTVILFAYNRDVLSEYHTLKAFRREAEAGGRLSAVEEEIAWRFGRLLSYSEGTIRKLLSENSESD